MIDTTNMGIMANLIQPTTSAMATEMISAKDSDEDSSLSLEELGIDSDIFSSFDSDEDGLLSQSELTSAIDSAMSQYEGSMPTKEEFQSILSSFGFEAPDSTSNSSSLSTSQQETISSVLENYDADNLSSSDAAEIIAAFTAAGIEPGEEMEAAMKEEGFEASEIGILASGEEAEEVASGSGGSQGAASGGGSGVEEEEEYDEMDTNEDGVVSLEEIQDYYGMTSDDSSTQELSSNDQNALDNLQLLMQTLKGTSEDSSLEANNFDGLLKEINNQNNNSEINTYLENTSTSSGYAYA